MVACVGINFIYQIFRVLITYRFMGLRQIIVEAAMFVPVMLWILIAVPVLGKQIGLITGLLAIGFIGSRHVGDLLRVRLTGLALPACYPDLIACVLFLTGIVILHRFVVPLPHWMLMLPMVVLLVDTAHALVLQFIRTSRRVYECLGITLFGVKQEQSAVINTVIQK